MKYAMTALSVIMFSGAIACAPAKAHHNGETGGIVREGGHGHVPHHRKMKSNIVREGGHSNRRVAPHHGPHWGKHHHHGIHLEGGH